MIHRIFAVAVAALMLSTAGFAAPQQVRAVEVTLNADAIQNAKAAAHWIDLPADLNKAIMARLGDQMSESGAKVLIDLSHVELANSYQTAFGVAESKLVGDIIVRNADSDVEMHRYELTVSFADAGPFFPEGVDLKAIKSDSPEYYASMVKAFADRVVSNLN